MHLKKPGFSHSFYGPFTKNKESKKIKKKKQKKQEIQDTFIKKKINKAYF